MVYLFYDLFSFFKLQIKYIYIEYNAYFDLLFDISNFTEWNAEKNVLQSTDKIRLTDKVPFKKF